MEQKNTMPVEYEVVDLLKKKDLKVTFAESCTGGMLAARLVNVSGASEVFDSSVVTYSNEMKKMLLGVDESTLNIFGAVSTQTAEEMAVGAASRLGADVAVSVTGIAGPGGGTDRKPVGLVYMACNVLGNVTVKECYFIGERLEVRSAAVEAALQLLKECLEKL